MLGYRLNKGLMPDKRPVAGSLINHQRNRRPTPRSKPDGALESALFGIDFKHAVEFSSFGCVLRFDLPASAWGNSSYFSEVFGRCQLGPSDLLLPTLNPGRAWQPRSPTEIIE